MASPTPPRPGSADNYSTSPLRCRKSSDAIAEDTSSIILGYTSDGPEPKRLIIGIDFGTTYSAVSYVAVPEQISPETIDPNSIRSIQNYPESWNFSSRDQVLMEVPTEVIYPLNQQSRRREMQEIEFRNSGSDIVPDDDSEMDLHDPDCGIKSQQIPQRDEDDDTIMSTDDSKSFRWGYEVHELWSLPSTHSDTSYAPLARFKLLLDESPMTLSIRDNVKTLLHKSRIRKPEHVIADFLTCLLKHTQSELLKEGFDSTWRKEVVLSVPAIWTQKACREMQTCLAMAMNNAQFHGVDVQNNHIENLFIVSEPEAAAEHILTAHDVLKRGDVFVLLDAGGGTVDANTYEISKKEPLRLSKEVVAIDGGLYGSSYLNQSFREYLHDLLADETYLEQGSETINGIIERIILDHFEYRLKRTYDCYAARGYKHFAVSGLRDNSTKNFKKGCIRKINEIFLDRLRGIASIMENQLVAAMSLGHKVEMVVLIGGFAASISLKKFLKKRLDQFNRQHDCCVTLMTPPLESTMNAVASGAVLRALNKTQGPQRIARSSYGVLRAEPFGDHGAHEGLTPSYDKLDGQPYIMNTIDWVLKLGHSVPSVWQCQPFLCSHTFAKNSRHFICREVLYVSDTSTESHYRLSHPKNKGAEMVGEIVVDFTFLREQGLVRLTGPTMNRAGKKVGSWHYRVNFTMVIRVVDRDLECYAIHNNQVKKKCRINIASGFRPGVK
ncbi:hypothetical protein B0I35DRAFT_397312 [Stachybotrys elegans]|uniref:Uncharacterized protein n=1 Tax=Stachybotrys elegans TaxID=80388 RepID=A0A8K0WNV2_9HYPO|nr:hypothetical protein B0I35DRAFT_397312 [Stachybotrys elegans]